MQVSDTNIEATTATGLPPWYQEGSLLTHSDLFRLDAAEFIEGDEYDYPWRLCRVPVALLEPAASWDEAVAGFLGRVGEKPEDIADEHERIDSIRGWFEQDGIEKCLEERPLVVLLTSDGSLKILDGFHRRAVAVHLYHATHVLAAVGLGDPVE